MPQLLIVRMNFLSGTNFESDMSFSQSLHEDPNVYASDLLALDRIERACKQLVSGLYKV